MPDRKVHNEAASRLVKLPRKEIDRINRRIDSPIALKLFAGNHRKHWGHSMRDLLLIALTSDRPLEALEAGYVHVILDKIPKKKRPIFEYFLEMTKGEESR